MGISSANVQQPKVSDWEKAMAMGAQLQQAFSSAAAIKMQQDKQMWESTKDMITLAGKDIIGGDGAAMSMLRPLITKNLSRISGEPEANVSAGLNDFFNYVKENPNFDWQNEAAITSYVFNYPVREGQPGGQLPNSPLNPNPPTETNASQVTTTPTTGGGKKQRYVEYEPEVVEAFSRFGIGTGATPAGPLPKEREEAVRNRLKEAGIFDQGKIDWIISEYNRIGYIPHTKNLQTYDDSTSTPTSQTRPSNSVALTGDVNGEQSKLGMVTKVTSPEGKISFTFSPSENLSYSTGKGFKSVIEDLVKSSGAPTKGVNAIDLNRYYQMVAEENIPEMAKALNVNEQQLRQKYKARPNEMLEDFNSLAPNIKNIKLPVAPGSPEYAQMFTVGVNKQKLANIKGAYDNLSQTLSDIDTGVIHGPEKATKLVEATNQYMNKLERIQGRIAVDRSYMRSVFGKMGGGDPEAMTNEDVLNGLMSSLDAVLNNPTRATRISASAKDANITGLEARLMELGLKMKEFDLAVQKFGWEKQMDIAKLNQAMNIAGMEQAQKMIADEKGERSNLQKAVMEIDKQLNEEFGSGKKGETAGWQKDTEQRARLYRDSDRFRSLWDARWGLIGSMTGQNPKANSQKVQTGKGWGLPWDEKEIIEMPYVDTSLPLPPTQTEQRLMGNQQAQTQPQTNTQPTPTPQVTPQTTPNPYDAQKSKLRAKYGANGG